MNEGVPQEEAFVPPEEQDRFVELSRTGEEQKVEEEEKNKQAAKDLTIGSTLGFAAGVVGFSPVAPVAVGPLVGSIFFGSKGIIEGRGADKAREKKEEAFNASRTIVNREMRKGGATQVSGEMRPTAEQIELARQEAERAGADIVRPENVG